MDGQRRRPQRTDHGDGEIGLANGASTYTPHYIRGTYDGGLSDLVRRRWERMVGPCWESVGVIARLPGDIVVLPAARPTL